MYQLFGSKRSWNRATGALSDVRSLMVVYMPFATAESTGLSPKPVQSGPWMMFPGTPKAHIMLVPRM